MDEVVAESVLFSVLLQPTASTAAAVIHRIPARMSFSPDV
jgi:hypothetical protein